MQLHRTDMSSAEATFQRVLDAHPRCVEVLRALGYLHARLPNTKAKALEYYEREMHVLAEDANASEEAALCFTDANLFLEAGLLYEASSARRARKAYAMAADILQRGDSQMLPELWNNLGALGQLAGDDDAAVFADYDCAARKCTAALADARARLAELRKGGASHGSSAAAAGARGAAAGEVQRLESTRATLSYNVARFYERCGMWASAEALYTRLLADVPTYVDATLRLAHLAFFVRSDADRALALVAQAIDVDSKRAAAWLLRGNIELHRQHVQDARRAFEHVLKDIAKHDVYALCSLGNFYLAAGRSEHARGSSGDATAADPAAAKRANDLSAQSYKRALEFFDKCLQLDERCAAAAHGTAIALAERGCAHEARQVFQDVRDAATAGLGPPTLCSTASDLVFKGAAAAARHSLPPPPPASSASQASGAEGCDVLLWSGINAAHVFVDTGNYRQAVLAYEASLRRLQDSFSSPARADEAADDSTSSAALSRFVVSALEAPKPSAAEAEPPLPPPPPATTTTRVTEVARAERKRVERDLRLYLVRALYIQAKAAKDIDIMRTALDHMRSLCTDECISLPPAATTTASVEETDDVVEMTTEEESSKKPSSAVRLSPDDCLLLFDLALIEQSVAQLVSEQPESQRTLQDLSLASANIAHSTAAFTFLASWGKTLQKKRQKLHFSPKLATERAGYSRSLVSKLERKHEEQAQFERQRQEHVEQWRKHQEEDELRKRLEVEAADQRQRELEAKLLKDAEERNAALRREQQQIADSDQPPQPPAAGKSKKNKSRDDFVSDDLLLAASDDSHDLLSRARKANKKLSARKNVAAASSEQPRGRVRTKPEGGHTDEDPDEPLVRKRRNVEDEDGDMDDDEQEEESMPHTTTGSTNKHKSKAIITDSDDSSDN
ncbi:protein required for normal CLN1 and CLN2 G1 cyclin expression [Coemansia sp. RSA 2424]|nr:protein required for normal CLN1 and CLN2 G1 cyclin expression [Coemansia sp. RSA 2424]